MTHQFNDQASELVDRPLLPPDHDAPRRAARLRELGLGQKRESEFDQFARELAAEAQRLAGLPEPPVAFVNLIGEDQFVGGVYTPPVAAELVDGILDTRIPLNAGYCPHVVVRRKALILDDVLDYPRFAGNPIVDRLMVRSYAGAPLTDRTGTVLGTVCIVDSEPRPWGKAGLELLKRRAADLAARINLREGLPE
ncbi:GAF domain-containing protein [Actinomadura hallensis]|uniref:GAF domain-containing protein n=1 Tax=Actinomadura hallensis TaxID=337895 RepID=A0A543IJW8_9ACTN|nr:GAF domain-containing protein [Actinomadura hallensis]TQM70877.1 GAF domain-containing protein [Actinomadura hallensis]HLV73105.1 GAF domain-containing protein [Vulgatibacteraceae bacterium]